MLFRSDGVNDVNVAIALSSAAVNTCPAVNVPSVAMSNHHPNLSVSRIPKYELLRMNCEKTLIGVRYMVQ